MQPEHHTGLHGNPKMTHIRSTCLQTVTRVLTIIAITAATIVNLGDLLPVRAACTITGTAYVDYDASGGRNGAEPPQAGIIVTAFLANSPIPLGTTTTLADGSYSLALTPPDGTQVRIEFSGIPTYLRPGRFGANNQAATTVAFAECTGLVGGINFALANPGKYCHSDNPQIATSCYVLGDQLRGPLADLPTFVSFPFSADGDPTPGIDPELHLAVARETGTTYGLAYHRQSDSFFVGSYVKRHAGLGPNDNLPGTNATTTGGIYRITPGSALTMPEAAAAQATMWLDLNAVVGTGPVVHPADPASCGPNPLNDCWLYDPATYDAVSKSGLGDMDMSEDDTTLYAINLFSRSLVIVPIVMQNGEPTPGPVGSIPLLGRLPIVDCPNAALDFRPFALEVDSGRIYIGAVCSAESTQVAANLRAYVFSADVTTLNPFVLEVSFPLDYPRRCADQAPLCGAARSALWNPWATDWPPIIPSTIPGNAGVQVHPEPLLSDIEVNGNSMVLGFRDRMGDRSGNVTGNPRDITSSILSFGISAGDTLKVCRNAAGVWELENNGTCGGVTTPGAAHDGEGPGDGEFYYTDYNDPARQRHDEVTLGALLQLPGSDLVVATAFDPLCETCGPDPFFDAGVVWFNNNTGVRPRSYRIFDGRLGGPGNTFGKSNGLGDLEAACGPMPLEIGNRVWEDLDLNGVQDPGEQPIGGVIVQLYMITDSRGVAVNRLVGQTTTNGAGEYYFNEANVFGGAIDGLPNAPLLNVNFDDLNRNNQPDLHEPRGVLANAVYEVRLDNPANYGAGGPLDQYYITSVDRATIGDGDDDMRDSDGRNQAARQLVSAANFPLIRLQTGGYGDNNHTYDFGFARIIPIVPTETFVPGTPGTPPPPYEVLKTVDQPFAAPGDAVVWTITVSNPGSTPLGDVLVEDPVPDTLDIAAARITVSSSSGAVRVDGQRIIFTQAVLMPGEVVTVNVPTRVRADVEVPFIIINEIPGTGASARLLSVTRLPNTGESPWSELRLPLLALGALLLAGFGVALRRRHR